MKEELSVGEFSDDSFVMVNSDTSKEDALDKFKSQKFEDKPSLYYIYVNNAQGKLEGVASVKSLMNSESIDKALETDYVSFKPEKNLEEAAREMTQYDHRAFPIVENGRMIGVLRQDDVLDLIQAEETEDIFKLAGVVDEDEFFKSKRILNSSILNEVRVRLPWLLFSLVGGLIAGSVIETHQQALQTVTILAFFIPVIMDMGGNVGTQSSTILVRGLTLGQIDRNNVYKHVIRESLAGLTIGIIVGSLAGLAAFLWQGSIGVASVVFLSMLLTCVAASFIGYIIPLIAEWLGKDPAAVSDPLVTTLKDITALLIYFTIAVLLLGI